MPEYFTVKIRQPRAIVSKESVFQITEPFVERASDVLEKLYQFRHITASFNRPRFHLGGVYNLCAASVLRETASTAGTAH